jgi:hypothetical protein
MFYYAMRSGGVTSPRAAVMYAAVYRFGPRWKRPVRGWGFGGILGRMGSLMRDDDRPPAANVGEADVQNLEALIEQHQPTTPEEVERLLRQ